MTEPDELKTVSSHEKLAKAVDEIKSKIKE